MRNEKRRCKYPQLMDGDWLYRQYWILENSLSEIGEDIGCNAQTVLNWMPYHKIDTRDCHECHQGHFNANYKQGEKFEGEKNTFYGKKHTKESKAQMRDSTVGMYDGENNPFYGKTHSEETIKRLTEIKKSEKYKKKLNATIHNKEYRERMRKIWDSEDFRQKMRDGNKHKTQNTHHTAPELVFMDICKRNNIPFHFVGDKQLWIGDKYGLNPDFIEANGKKICVEIMGDYWHSPLLNPHVKKNRTLPYRENHYKKYGWIPIFIWGTDLKREDVEQFVLNTLRKGGAIE